MSDFHTLRAGLYDMLNGHIKEWRRGLWMHVATTVPALAYVMLVGPEWWARLPGALLLIVCGMNIGQKDAYLRESRRDLAKYRAQFGEDA